MGKLRFVEITASPISDLSVLSEHKDIFHLDVSDTNITDIGFIEKIQHLSFLSLAGCPIKDYSPLFRMSGYLKHLEIDKKAAQLIGRENIRNRHIGVDITVGKETSLLDLLY